MTTTQAAETLRFPDVDPALFLHGIATRHGGVSRPPFESLNLSIKTGDDRSAVEENRRRFERMMGFETRQAVAGRLVHGAEVSVFRLLDLLPPIVPPDLSWPGFDSDAAISNVPGLVLIMTFADCVPVLLWDERNRACALAHAGWKGTALRIASKTVRAMTEAFGSDPGYLQAGIGPSIGQACYPVGDNVRREFEAGYSAESAQLFDGQRLDLWRANTLDLVSAGLKLEHVEVAGICTACSNNAYFSHRAENGSTGRFGACIGLRYPGRFGDEG